MTALFTHSIAELFRNSNRTHSLDPTTRHHGRPKESAANREPHGWTARREYEPPQAQDSKEIQAHGDVMRAAKDGIIVSVKHREMAIMEGDLH